MFSSDALLYIDPDYSFTAAGEPLYPSLVYLFRIKKPSSKLLETVDDDESAESAESEPEAEAVTDELFVTL